MRKRNFTRPVGLILSEETYKQVVEETDKKEVTISAWIRGSIENSLNQGKDSSGKPAKHFDKSLTFGGKEKTK